MGGGRSAPRPSRFTPRKDLVPIVQEAGWAPAPVWTGAENLALTGIRSLDCPARSESLYRLRYPDRLSLWYLGLNPSHFIWDSWCTKWHWTMFPSFQLGAFSLTQHLANSRAQESQLTALPHSRTCNTYSLLFTTARDSPETESHTRSCPPRQELTTTLPSVARHSTSCGWPSRIRGTASMTTWHQVQERILCVLGKENT